MAAVLTADVGIADTAAVAQEVDKGGAEVQKRFLSFLSAYGTTESAADTSTRSTSDDARAVYVEALNQLKDEEKSTLAINFADVVVRAHEAGCTVDNAGTAGSPSSCTPSRARPTRASDRAARIRRAFLQLQTSEGVSSGLRRTAPPFCAEVAADCGKCAGLAGSAPGPFQAARTL